MKIGIDLGGSHIAIGVIENNKIIEKKEKTIIEENKESKEKIEKFIQDNVIDFILEISKKYDIEEIGLAVPGNVTKTKIIKSVNLNIRDYDVIEKLESKIQKKIKKDIKVKLTNDAKAAMLAEKELGILKGYKRAIFLCMGTGVGGAVMIEGKLLNLGEHPGTEFGHNIICVDGKECSCGKKGCFEKYSSMKTFKEDLKKELKLKEDAKGQEIERIIRKYENYEGIENKEIKIQEKIEKVVNNYVKYTSIGISNIINIFEPEIICIGGSFSYLQDIFIPKIQEYIKENNLLFNKRENINIKSALLRNDAGILGSIL